MHRGHRVLFAALTSLVLIALAATVALGASPHFKRGGTPVCDVTSGGTTATALCRGTLAGLGNEDLLIDTTLSGFAVYQCQNHGGNTAPGQNKVLQGPTTTPTVIDADAIKNGNVTYSAPGSLSTPGTVSAADAGCPGANWTGVNPVLLVTDITQVISQGGVVLFTCTASNPEGLSGTVALTC